MKIDFSIVLKDLRGDPLKDAEGKDTWSADMLTLGSVAANALLAPAGQGEKLTGQVQLYRFQLATRIFAATEPLDLKAEDVVVIKNQIAANYLPLASGQAWEIIERAEKA